MNILLVLLDVFILTVLGYIIYVIDPGLFEQFILLLKTIYEEVLEIPKKFEEENQKLKEMEKPKDVVIEEVQKEAKIEVKEDILVEIPPKIYFVNQETQVTDIDFDILEYRTNPNITKTGHTSLLVQEELPVLIKGAYWKKYVEKPKKEEKMEQPEPESPVVTNPNKFLNLSNVQLVKEDSNLTPRLKEKESFIKRIASSIVHQTKAKWDYNVNNISQILFLIQEICQGIIHEKKINLGDKTIYKDGKLSLKGSGIFYLPNSILDYAEKLFFIDFSYNFLLRVPNWLSETFESLVQLDLSHNLLFDLPSEFQNLTKLKELNLSHNRFETIPQSIFNLSTLVSLNLKYNSLSCVPAEISRLKRSLTELDLSHNNLVDLPEDIKQLKRLKYIDLDHNKFFYYTNFNFLNTVFIPEDSKKKRKICAFQRLQGSDISVDPENMYKQLRNFISESKTILLFDLLISERSYLYLMNIFNEVYYNSLLLMAETNIELKLSVNEIETIIPKEFLEIITFANEFYSLLTEKIVQSVYHPNDKSSVIELFLSKKKSFIDVYTKYIVQYQKSLEFLEEFEKKNLEFVKIIAAKRKLAICGGLSIQNFLSLPLHRISKYHSTFVAMLEITNEKSKDYQLLNDIVFAFNELFTIQSIETDKINNSYQIMEIERIYQLKLRTSRRKFVKQAKLQISPNFDADSIMKEVSKYKDVSLFDFTKLNLEKLKDMKLDELPYVKTLLSKNINEVRIRESTVIFYLFSDMILIAETGLNSYNTYGAYTIYPLRKNFVNITLSNDNDKQFIIETDSNKKLILKTETTEDRKIFFDMIQNVIENLEDITEVLDNDDDLYVHLDEKSPKDVKSSSNFKSMISKAKMTDSTPTEKTPTSDLPKKDSKTILKGLIQKNENVNNVETPKSDVPRKDQATTPKSDVPKETVKIDIKKETVKSDVPVVPKSEVPKTDKKEEKKDTRTSIDLPKKDSQSPKKNEQKLDIFKAQTQTVKELMPLSPRESGYFQHSLIINAPIDKCMFIICDFEKYPEFLSNIRSSKIVKHDSVAQITDVEFSLFFGTVSYTLRHQKVSENIIQWTCLPSKIFSKNIGSWQLEQVDKGVKATYTCIVQFLINNSMIHQFFIGKTLTNNLLAIKERIEKK